MKKEVTSIDKDSKENVVTICYKIKFIDTARFMADLVNNLTEEVNKIKFKDRNCFLEYESFKDNLINYPCLSCNKDYSNKIYEELKNPFNNTFKISNNDINKFILLLRKCVYLYELMDDWEKFNETTLPEKQNFIAT